MDYLHNAGLDRILDDISAMETRPISAPPAPEPPGTPAGPETPRKTASGAGETGEELERWDGLS